jgi:proteasome lid subunit RPN8/RPN11
MNPPKSHPKFHIQEPVLRMSEQVFRSTRGLFRRHEGIVYWVGRQCRGDWVVTTCVAPRAHTTPGSFRTSAGANAAVVTAINAAGLELVAQAHSHPGEFIDHSDGDSCGALMPYEGFVSIVVPNYGSEALWPLTRCGVHRFESGKFHRLSTDEVTKTFRLIPSFIDLRK